MKCNKDDLLLEQSDFDCVADISCNCDINTMCKFVREAQETLLHKHIGWALLDELLQNPDKHKDLLCGSTFCHCNKTEKHFGLKRVLVFYSYGLYALRGSVQSQAHGMVQKLVQDSVPLNIKDLNQIKKENFQLAQEYWTGVEKYLCANRDKYAYYGVYDCGCGGKCGCDGSSAGNGHDDSNIGTARIRKVTTFRKY